MDETFVIGYLARIDPDKGLHHLVDAFRLLAADVGSERLRLEVAGYLVPRHVEYLKDLEARLETAGLSDFKLHTEQSLVAGDPSAVREQLSAFVELGFDMAILTCPRFQDLDDMKLFGDEVRHRCT